MRFSLKRCSFWSTDSSDWIHTTSDSTMQRFIHLTLETCPISFIFTRSFLSPQSQLLSSHILKTIVLPRETQLVRRQATLAVHYKDPFMQHYQFKCQVDFESENDCISCVHQLANHGFNVTMKYSSSAMQVPSKSCALLEDIQTQGLDLLAATQVPDEMQISPLNDTLNFYENMNMNTMNMNTMNTNLNSNTMNMNTMNTNMNMNTMNTNMKRNSNSRLPSTPIAAPPKKLAGLPLAFTMPGVGDCDPLPSSSSPLLNKPLTTNQTANTPASIPVQFVNVSTMTNSLSTLNKSTQTDRLQVIMETSAPIPAYVSPSGSNAFFCQCATCKAFFTG